MARTGIGNNYRLNLALECGNGRVQAACLCCNPAANEACDVLVLEPSSDLRRKAGVSQLVENNLGQGCYRWMQVGIRRAHHLGPANPPDVGAPLAVEKTGGDDRYSRF